MTYKIEDINIGDEVTFRSKNPHQSDYDECWTVHGKKGDDLLIHVNYIGEEVYWSINVNEVITRIPTGNKK